MKAIILAAGVGSRLRPMTNDKPKCLIKSAGKEILSYQLDAYRKAGISEIAIVIGYEGQSIINYCKHIRDINITIIENLDYEFTNNMYSLYLAREFLKGDSFILNNADLTIDIDIVVSLVESTKPNLVAVDSSVFNDESMKVSLNQEGEICNISKAIEEPDSFGCSIDFYKFSAESGASFLEYVSKIIEQEGNLKDWTEVAMQRLFLTGELRFEALEISGKRWVEIDDYEDLGISDRLFSQVERKIIDHDHFCFDLDGTLYLGNKEIPGSTDALKYLVANGKKVTFLSNNSSKSKEKYLSLLKNLGIEWQENDIVLSSDTAIAFLLKNRIEKVFVLGTKALQKSVMKAGITITTENPEYVLVGYDTELNYDKLTEACALLNKGVDMLATHCDVFCPSEHGPIPDIGALLKMLEMTTGKKPYKIFGKPSVEMIELACVKAGAKMEDSIMIGDRIYTDMIMVQNTAASSLLVLTGDTSRDELEKSNVNVDYVLNSVADIL